MCINFMHKFFIREWFFPSINSIVFYYENLFEDSWILHFIKEKLNDMDALIWEKLYYWNWTEKIELN